MWKFSLRELILVITVSCIALGANLWSNRELRSDRRQLARYALEMRDYTRKLRETLLVAQQEKEQTQDQIDSWTATGELKERASAGACYSGYVRTDWSVLNKPEPSIK